MGRYVAFVSAALAVALCFAHPASAGVPDPDLSEANSVVISPDGALSYVVTVNSVDGPVDSANVELVFSSEADSLLCWCVGQTRGTISATTDINGEATFFISGGGCVDSALVGSAPVEIFANSIKIGEAGVVSPDAVDDAALKPTDPGYDPLGLCTVGLSDASYFTPFFKTSAYDFCSDLNGDGAIDISDPVIATPGISGGVGCTAQ